MSKKTTVILPTPGQFRRTVRKDGRPVLDEAGKPRVLVFNSREGVELTDEELEAVRGDIGNVLFIAKVQEGKPVCKVDTEATAAFLQAAQSPAKGAGKASTDRKPVAKAAHSPTGAGNEAQAKGE